MLHKTDNSQSHTFAPTQLAKLNPAEELLMQYTCIPVPASPVRTAAQDTKTCPSLVMTHTPGSLHIRHHHDHLHLVLHPP